MTFNELMNVRKYLAAACTRLTALELKCGIDTYNQWERFGESWEIVKAFMDAHPDLPYVC